MAISLNGTTQLLEIGSVPTISGPLLSMSLWFYPTDATSIVTVGCLGVDSARYQIRTGDVGGANSTICAQMIDGATNQVAISGNSYTQNAWNHAFASFNATTERIRMNGGTAVSNAISTVTPITKTTLGGRYSGGVAGSFFPGRVAEFAVWNAVLTSDEEIALSKGYSPLLVRPDKLELYWPAVRDGQDVMLGTSATLTGSPSVIEHPRILKR